MTATPSPPSAPATIARPLRHGRSATRSPSPGATSSRCSACPSCSCSRRSSRSSSCCMFRYVFGGAIACARRRLRRLPHARASSPRPSRSARSTPAIGLADDLQQGSDRALPVAADGPLGGAGRAHARRPRAQRASSSCSWRPSGSSSASGSTPTCLACPGAARRAAAVRFALSWVFALVGLAVAERRDGAGRVVPDPGAARVRVVGVRAGRRRCRAGSRSSPSHQPVSVVVNAVARPRARRADRTPVLQALAWCAASSPCSRRSRCDATAGPRKGQCHRRRAS